MIPWDMTSYDTVREIILQRAAALEGYDIDGDGGLFAWDLGANLMMNAGHETFWTRAMVTGDNGSANQYTWVATTWTYEEARNRNAAAPFTAVSNINNIERGDLVIWGVASVTATGHCGFADENFANGKTTISTLGQNQTDPDYTYGHVATINNLSKAGIVGAFRYTPWNGGSPVDPPNPPIPDTPASGYILHPNGTKIPILKRGLQLRKRRL